MKEYKYKINGNEYAVAINEVCDTTAKVTETTKTTITK